jgi:hypothetical protein
VTRSFNGFQAAANEAGLSRIYGGVHTRLDHLAGLELGRDVAQFALVVSDFGTGLAFALDPSLLDQGL